MKTIEISEKQIDALRKLADWVIGCDDKEYHDYVTFCEENKLDPNKIRGRIQRHHPYALALFGLGLEY